MNTIDLLAVFQTNYYGARNALPIEEAVKYSMGKGDATKRFFTVTHKGRTVHLVAGDDAVTIEVDGEVVATIKPRGENEPIRSWKPRLAVARAAMMEPLGL